MRAYGSITTTVRNLRIGDQIDAQFLPLVAATAEDRKFAAKYLVTVIDVQDDNGDIVVVFGPLSGYSRLRPSRSVKVWRY